MQWGKKGPVQMNLPFFAVEASVPGGGGPESGRKIQKMPSGRHRCQNLLFQLMLLQKYRDTTGSRIVIHMLLSAKTRAYVCKSVAIKMGGVLRYFSTASGSVIDLSLSASSKRSRICTAPFEWDQAAVFPGEGVQIWVRLFLYGRS